MIRPSSHSVAAAAVLAVLFAAIYAPAIGHGFMKDDFRWIAAAEVHSAADLGRIAATNLGFYRPLVTTSFAIDRGLWGLDARGYAATNAALLLADAVLLALLALRLGLPSTAALFAAAVWVFNFHGINMALLWISGRTALLLCAFALAATHAILRGHRFVAGLLTLGALLCKEEAVMLPPFLAAVDIAWNREGDETLHSALVRSWPLWIAAGLYALLRIRSGAFGVSDAPIYYQLTVDPRVLLKNVAEYVDRGATAAMAAAMMVWLAAPKPRQLNAAERSAVRFGVSWFAAMFAITAFLPVRSSLYAVAPSIGSALTGAAFASAAARASSPRFARASAVLIAIVALLIPVYRSRNHGFVEPQDLAMQSLATLRQAALGRADLHAIVLVDDPGAPVTLDAAFGALLPDAVHLFVAPGVPASLNEGPAGTTGSRDEGVSMFELRGGRLVQARP